jgi:hypothetical protein
MVGTIISYRFNNLSRKEVETMLAKSFAEHASTKMSKRRADKKDLR